MRNSLWSIAVLFVAIVAPTVLRANTIYSVNQPIGGASATGFITTDGHVGTLTLSDIVGWNLTLNDGTNTTDLVPSNSFVYFGNNISGTGNADLSATSQNLLFNYSQGDNGFLSFEGASGQICYTSESNCWGPAGVGVFGVAGVGGSVYVAETGNQVIGTATPEPSSLLLLGSGLGVAIMGMRRKLHRQAR